MRFCHTNENRKNREYPDVRLLLRIRNYYHGNA